jgi:hypothetical protein
MATQRTSQYFNGSLYQRMSDDLHLAGMLERTRLGCVRDCLNVVTEPRWGSNGRALRSRGSRVSRQPLALRHNRIAVESHPAAINRVPHRAEHRYAVSSENLGLLPTGTTPGHGHPIVLNSEGVPSLPRLCIC